MNGKQLRNSILQWAIQGKLVPQDPNDEPASVLLERIREEKARLVKEKKIKRDKNESIIYRGDDNSYYEKFTATGEVKCIDDEIPFDLPASWQWIRLHSIVDFSKSNSVKASLIDANAWLLDLEDIEKDTGKLLRKKRMSETSSKSDKHSFKAGNVLYSKLRPYLNKVIVADEDGYCTSEILCFDFGMIDNRYAQLYFMSPFFVDYAMSDAYGVKMPRLGSKQGNNGLMAIPPLEEQHKIVDFYYFLLPLIEKYDKAQTGVNEINDAIKPLLRKSILQEAIQGRLVEQCKTDEPASVLLEQIKAEKERLVKAGLLKKSALQDTVIFKGDDNKYFEKRGKEIACIDDEIPFEIPDSWEWVRFGSLINMRIGKTPPRGDVNFWSNGTTPWISISDMSDYGIIKHTKEQVSDFAIKTTFASSIVPAGTLIMSFKLTVGRTSILDIDAVHNEAIISIKPYVDSDDSLRDYLFYILPLISNFGDSKDAIKGKTLNSTSLFNLLIPLPPLVEQRRIVNAIIRAWQVL